MQTLKHSERGRDVLKHFKKNVLSMPFLTSIWSVYGCLGAIINIRVGILESLRHVSFIAQSVHIKHFVVLRGLYIGLYLGSRQFGSIIVMTCGFFPWCMQCIFFNLWQMKCIDKCTPYNCCIKSITFSRAGCVDGKKGREGIMAHNVLWLYGMNVLGGIYRQVIPRGLFIFTLQERLLCMDVFTGT